MTFRNSVGILAFAIVYCSAWTEPDVVQLGLTELRNVSVSLTLDSPMYSLATSSNYIPDKTPRKTLRVISALSFSSIEGVGGGPVLAEATSLALDRLRALPNWLPNYEIVIEQFDDGCMDSVVIGGLTSRLRENNEANSRFPIALLSEGGSGLSQIPSSLFMEQFNFIGLGSYPMTKKLTTQKASLKNDFHLGEPADYYWVALAKFLATMNWRRVAMISEIDPYFNAVDNFMVHEMERNNITITYMGKVSDYSEDEQEWVTIMDDMKQRDPRIILVQTYSSPSVSCWLSRYGFTGPQYAIFYLGWSSVDETTDPPEYAKSWCTKEMIFDVASSLFLYQDTDLTYIYGPSWTDETGYNAEQFRETLKARLIGAETSPAWASWTPAFYDKTLILGFVLNKTEEILNQRNQTLSDWFTNSEQFQINGAEIVEILKEAFYSLKIRGLKGIYSFDRNTGLTKGSQPVVFFQVVPENGPVRKSKLVNVGFYDSSREPTTDQLFINKSAMTWRTKNRQPPRDKMTIINALKPMLPVPVGIFMKCMHASCFVITLAILLVPKRIRMGLGISGAITVFGDFLMFSHEFFVPTYELLQTWQCMASAILFFTGYSMAAIGLHFTLSDFHQFLCDVDTSTRSRLGTGISHPSRSRCSSMNQRLSAVALRKRNRSNSAQNIIIFAFSMLNLSLIVAALLNWDTDFVRLVKIGLVEKSDDDPDSLAYQFYNLQCHFIDRKFLKSSFSEVTGAIIGACHVAILLRITFLSMRLTNQIKDMRLLRKVTNAKVVPNLAHGHMLVLLACVFIAIMQPENGYFLAILFSIASVAFATLNVTLISVIIAVKSDL